MRTFYKHERNNLVLEMLFLLGFVSGFFLWVRQLISHGLILWNNHDFVVTLTLSLKTQILSGATYRCRELSINPTGAAEAVKWFKPCTVSLPDPKPGCSASFSWGCRAPSRLPCPVGCRVRTVVSLLALLTKTSKTLPKKRVWRPDYLSDSWRLTRRAGRPGVPLLLSD